jgi:HSP20 family protein
MNLEKRANENKNIETTRGGYYETPDCDIYEDDNDYVMYFDIPGVDKDQINLKVEKDVLTLTADCTKQADQGYHCVQEEMGYTGYKRSFELNQTVEGDKICADYKEGTLKLTLPKREEQKTKEIKITVN